MSAAGHRPSAGVSVPHRWLKTKQYLWVIDSTAVAVIFPAVNHLFPICRGETRGEQEESCLVSWLNNSTSFSRKMWARIRSEKSLSYLIPTDFQSYTVHQLTSLTSTLANGIHLQLQNPVESEIKFSEVPILKNMSSCIALPTNAPSTKKMTVCTFFLCYCSETSRLDLAWLSMQEANLIIIVTPLQNEQVVVASSVLVSTSRKN